MGLNNKRLLVVTWKGCNNYGTHLQCYALLNKLQICGYKTHLLCSFNISNPIKNIINFILEKAGYFQKKEQKYYNSNEKLRKVYLFHQTEIPEYKITTRFQFNRMMQTTDVFITGSDQIWNTNHHFRPFYFLDFAQNKKRIAYASSIGSSFIEEKYKPHIKYLLSKFQHIGIREQSAIDFLSNVTGRNDIVQVIDPTFLLRPSDWQTFHEKAEIDISIPKKYIFCYLIGCNNNYTKQLMDVKEKSGIENIIIIKSAENPTFCIEGGIKYDNAGPREFLHLLVKASLVCTDSFHATALSINHSKPFVEFLRFNQNDIKSQNSRIFDLLEHYCLMSRFYEKESVSWLDKIDYSKIQSKLEEDRTQSINFLISAIEK